MTNLSEEREYQPVKLLAVRPHPDDESTSTGGMLAYYSSKNTVSYTHLTLPTNREV